MSAREYFEGVARYAALAKDLEARIEAVEAGLREQASDGVSSTASDPSWRALAVMERLEQLREQWLERLDDWRDMVAEAVEVAQSIDTGRPQYDAVMSRSLLLGYIDGMSPSEAAEAIGCSVGAYYTAKSRALAYLDENGF